MATAYSDMLLATSQILSWGGRTFEDRHTEHDVTPIGRETTHHVIHGQVCSADQQTCLQGGATVPLHAGLLDHSNALFQREQDAIGLAHVQQEDGLLVESGEPGRDADVRGDSGMLSPDVVQHAVSKGVLIGVLQGAGIIAAIGSAVKAETITIIAGGVVVALSPLEAYRYYERRCIKRMYTPSQVQNMAAANVNGSC